MKLKETMRTNIVLLFEEKPYIGYRFLMDVLTAKVENPVIQIDFKKETFEMSCDVWYDGTWHNGGWVDGIWKDGVWITGMWYDGIWENGIWSSGWIYDYNENDYVASSLNPNEYKGSLSYKKANK